MTSDDDHGHYTLDKKRYPHLGRLKGAERAELSALIDELRPPRATRHPQRVIAKIVREHRGEQVEESVLVREVSESGIVVDLAQHNQLELVEACHLTFWLRARHDGEERQLELSATLVRLIELRRGVATLAFHFDETSQEQRALLHGLGHWCRAPSLTPSAG